MANSKSFSPELSRAEQTAGLCFLPFYVVLLPLGIKHLSRLLSLNLTDLQINICWFVLNFLVVWIIFHNFLLRSFRNIRFWEFVQALILGAALYYAGNLLFGLLVEWLGVDIGRFNDETLVALAAENRTVMILCVVILAPMVEETLVRGLIFGSIRKKNRIAAYVISIALFAAIHVWQYIPVEGIGSVALAALPYLPAGIALAWTHEKANTVWAPIVLHGVINAAAFGIMTIW